MNKQTAARNGKVDLLKFIFSVTVAIFHFNCTVEYKGEIFNKAYMAVEFFFIVSGYFMAKSLSKFENRKDIDVLKEGVRFSAKKYTAIFPYHVYAYVLTIALWIPYFGYSVKEWALEVFRTLPGFFLLKMFGYASVPWLMTEWYLSSMLIVMFVLAPVIIKYRKFYTYYIAPILVPAFIALVFKKCHTLNVFEIKDNIVWTGNLRAAADISLGLIIYEVTQSGILEKFSRKILLLAEGICYLITFVYVYKDLDTKYESAAFIVLVFGAVLTFSKKTSLDFLDNKLVGYFGKLSLSIYLCHSVARYCIAESSFDFNGYYPHLAVFLIYTFVLSIICTFTVDLLKKNFSKRK